MHTHRTHTFWFSNNNGGLPERNFLQACDSWKYFSAESLAGWDESSDWLHAPHGSEQLSW